MAKREWQQSSWSKEANSVIQELQNQCNGDQNQKRIKLTTGTAEGDSGGVHQHQATYTQSQIQDTQMEDAEQNADQGKIKSFSSKELFFDKFF